MRKGEWDDAMDALPVKSVAVLFAFVLASTFAFYGNPTNRPLLKFCFNSRDQFVAAQCVLCDFYQFSTTVLSCNGKTSALMSNITSTEAVCIISNCLQQVRQAQPQYTGRRRRDADPTTTTSVASAEASTEPDVAEEPKASDALKEALKHYALMDDWEMEELEERIVDTIEVMVDEIEEEEEEYD